MIGKILRLLGVSAPPLDQLPAPKTQVLPLKPDEWEPAFKSFGENPAACADCGCREFLFGPKGGMCQNVQCSDCGAQFNVMLVPGAVMVQRLRRPQQVRRAPA